MGVQLFCWPETRVFRTAFVEYQGSKILQNYHLIHLAANTLFGYLPFYAFLNFRIYVLEAVKHMQKYQQMVGISFEKFVVQMRSLKFFLKNRRNEMVRQALQFARNTWEDLDITWVKRTVRKKTNDVWRKGSKYNFVMCCLNLNSLVLSVPSIFSIAVDYITLNPSEFILII